MRAPFALAAISIALFGCSSEPAPLDHAPATSDAIQLPSTSVRMFRCGTQTSQEKAEAYFTDLAAALHHQSDPAQFNRFMAPSFSINSGGANTTYNLADFRAITPDFVTIEEWREIERRGLVNVFDAGWRGCALDHGKVWFDAYGEEGLKLKSLDRDLEWVVIDEAP